jgi:hypothetical protein
MDDLAFVRERIESYADYTNSDDRRLSDEQIRAYVGEALSRLLERLRPDGDAGEALEQLISRCQFADQHVIRVLDETTPTPAQIGQFHGLDRALVALADREPTVSSSDLAGYLAEIGAALDRRSHGLMRAA